MSALSDAEETAILNALYRNTAYTPAPSLTLALHSASPTDADLANELSGLGYSRQVLTVGAPSSGSCTNDALLTFTASGGDWAVVTHFSVRNGSTGSLISHGALTASVAVTDGSSINFQIGAITLSID